MILLDNIDPELMSKIHNGSFPLPDLSNKSYIGRKTVIDNGCVIGFGLVKLTLEGILILDNVDSLKSQKTRAIHALILSFIEDMQKLGFDECHVFVKNELFISFLEHLGFQRCQGGTPMVIHF